MLELYDGKLSCTVLRRESGSNARDLSGMSKIKRRSFMKKIALLLLLLLIPTITHAYEGSPKQQVADFFKDLSAGKNNEAIDNLFLSNPTMKQRMQELTLLKQQILMIESIYGKSIGQEDFAIEQPTKSITRIVTVDNHEHHPIVWEFYFYKSGDKWIVSHATFNDQFSNLVKKL